ncbi:SWIM zinc finger family protein [Natronolimnohabitans sp. A-GB9]|nr:SWIM zinc finger family protein [Natronolimnohabitans sp. A-GB9]MDQ2052751.1 SWIM zinc finger family protein [Natronolimnohabitans sp. A-GB9]
MEQGPTVTEAAIKRLARSKSYDHGENHYDQGAVIDITHRGDTLRGEVEGSQYEPYQVRIELDDTGIVETTCSCPYDHGGICKHRVTVLLTYVRDPDSIDQRPSVSELVADADPADLREVILDLVEHHPELAGRVETRLETGQGDDASVRPRISTAIRFASTSSTYSDHQMGSQNTLTIRMPQSKPM